MNFSQLPTALDARVRSAARTHPAAQPALVLGRYRLDRNLGSGGFGTVWAARDERLEREVAVKILPRERIVGGRFEREARAAARLAHPAIVTLYEAAVDDEGAYLVSELVRGPTLGELLDAGRLSDRDIVQIAIALSDALIHAHSQGVIHRDVKPSNILIPAQPTSAAHPAKLTDFGVARVLGGDTLTRTGDVVGTIAYMSPEQAAGREAGAPADLYSLALVTYEALTGVNPLRAGSLSARASRLGTYLPPLRRQRRQLPRELGVAIDLALRPRPSERGSVDELRAALLTSLHLFEDTPGVIVDSGPAITITRRRHADQEPGPEWRDEAGREQVEHDVPSPVAPAGAATPWPARAACSVAAAFATAWLCAHLLVMSPVAPAAAGLIAAAVVLLLTRVGWLAVIAALAATAAAQGRPAGALVWVMIAIATIAVLVREPTSWPLPAGAVALGLAGVAGAWPAVVARSGARLWQRTALAAAGYVWLAGAGAVAGIDLYTHVRPTLPQPAAWTSSAQLALHHVAVPILNSGLLPGMAIWAAAAAVLPWIVTGASLARDVVITSVWAATLVSATEAVGSRAGTPAPVGAVLGAVLGAAIALLPALLTALESRVSRTRVP